MKRSMETRRSLAEQRLDNNRHYGTYIGDKKKGLVNVNPIFLQDNYGIKKGIEPLQSDQAATCDKCINTIKSVCDGCGEKEAANG